MKKAFEKLKSITIFKNWLTQLKSTVASLYFPRSDAKARVADSYILAHSPSPVRVLLARVFMFRNLLTFWKTVFRNIFDSAITRLT